MEIIINGVLKNFGGEDEWEHAKQKLHMSNKWTWKTAHLSPGAGVVVVKKVEGQWMVFGMWAREGYDVPKGHVEDGETHFETAVRECEEECAITDLNFQWGEHSLKIDNLILYVASTSQEGEIIPNIHTGIYEHENCKWLTFEEMKYKAYDYLKPGIWWAEALTRK